jgi:hypothetical protein
MANKRSFVNPEFRAVWFLSADAVIPEFALPGRDRFVDYNEL